MHPRCVISDRQTAGITVRETFRDERIAAIDSTSEARLRSCLVCRDDFPSEWAGERVCRRCKSSSVWRSGALR
jgi:hypothetical protein